MNFSDLGLGPKTLQGIELAGYNSPTPIQSQVIPLVLKRHDLFGCAQTGTGKTASYTLPILHILENGRQRARMPRVLVLAPTRELAQQVEQSFTQYGTFHGFKNVTLIGGESIYEQEKRLSKGPDILIATPGRLLDLFERGRIMPHAIEVLVIDEADRMLDMGFIPDVEKILGLLSKNCQTLLFSATFSEEIKKIAQKFLKNPDEIFISRSSKTAETVEHFAVKAEDANKRNILKALIDQENPKSSIIFCNRKKDISALCTFLKRAKLSTAPLHGDLTQSVRTKTLEEFKSGQIRFLVASDVAARGLDIDDIDVVFNFDVPNNAEEYVHRIGRTGRAGRKGKAYTFMSEKEIKLFKAIESLIKTKIPFFEVLSEEDKKPEMIKTPKSESLPQQPSKPIQSTPTKHQKPRHPNKGPIIIGFGNEIPKFMMHDLHIPESHDSKAIV